MTGPVAVWRCSLLIFIVQLFLEICICLVDGIERNPSCLDACFLDLQSFFFLRIFYSEWICLLIQKERDNLEGDLKICPKKQKHPKREGGDVHAWFFTQCKSKPRIQFCGQEYGKPKGMRTKNQSLHSFWLIT